jgi:hypothetical protein
MMEEFFHVDVHRLLLGVVKELGLVFSLGNKMLPLGGRSIMKPDNSGVEQSL